MGIKKLKNTIVEYGFLAEPHITMSTGAALALTDGDGAPSFERLVSAARAKADLPDEAWAPAEKLARRLRSHELQPHRGRKLRFSIAAVFAVLIALLLILPSGRAFAKDAVVRLWSALVHWDADYLRVDYNGGYEDPPQSSPGPYMGEPVDEEGEEFSISTVEELKGSFGGRVLYPYDLEGTELLSAKGTVFIGNYGNIRIEYTVVGAAVLCICLLGPEEDLDENNIASSSIHQGSFDDVYEKNINGVDCIFGIADEKTVCTFVVHNDLYSITVRSGAELTEEIVRSMLNGYDAG